MIDSGVLSWRHCNVFSDRIFASLKERGCALRSGSTKKEIITFSPAAERLWMQVFNEIELGIKLGGRFYRASDHASKLAENIARVAALLEVFEHGSMEISRSTLEFSIRICMWYSDEFKRLFVLPSQDEVDVSELKRWLEGKSKNGIRVIGKNEILQCGPSRVRKKDRLEKAIETLCGSGEVSIYVHNKKEFVNMSVRRNRPAKKVIDIGGMLHCVPFSA